MRHYPYIDVLRGFAALSVLVYHVIKHSDWSAFPEDGPLAWFHAGWMGVDMFFVISGCVIMLAAWRGIETTADLAAARRDFAWKRIARIVPLYVVTGAVFLVIFPEPVEKWPGAVWHALSHLTFTHNWFVPTHGSINGPNWSVAAEMQFYVLVLLGMPWLSRLKPIVFLLACVVIAWVLRAVCFGVANMVTIPVSVQFIYATQVPAMLDLFAAGMAVAFYLRQRGDRPVSRKELVILGLAASVTMVWVLSWFWRYSFSYWHQWHMVIFWRSGMALATGLLLLWLTLLPPTRLRLLRPLFYMGEISYGIYLWHLPVIMLLQPVPFPSPWVRLAAVFTLVLVLASCSWRWLERPAMHWARQRTATEKKVSVLS